MSQVAPFADILARVSVAMTQNWQQVDPSPSDRDGVLLFNTSASSNVPYRFVGTGGSAPSGAGAISAASGVIGPLETRFIAIGKGVAIYAYAVTGTDALIMEETK